MNPLKNTELVKKKKRNKISNDELRVYAQHYPTPISDIKGFNKVLKENTGATTRRRRLQKVLGY